MLYEKREKIRKNYKDFFHAETLPSPFPAPPKPTLLYAVLNYAGLNTFQ